MYLFIFREGGRQAQREGNISLPPVCALTWERTAIQAHVLTGNQTSDLLLCRTMPNQLSHTGQGKKLFLELNSSRN